MRTLDERRAWRERQWARRNRSAAWLIEHSIREAEETHAFVKPPRPARCGWPIGKATIQLLDGKASIRNLEHCASPWACPICATIIRTQRAKDLQQAANTWASQGHGLLFATLTRPHMRTEPLETGMDVVGRAWMGITKSTKWRTIRRNHGITHWVKTTEITRNPTSGWHVHIHLLLFTASPKPDPKALQKDLYDIWDAAVQHQGGRPVSKKHGVLVLPVQTTPGKVGRYIAKPPDRIGPELMRMDNKTGRVHSLAPFQLLDTDTISRLGENTARDLWLEYVNATRGQNSVTWSRRLRAELIGSTDQTDQQIIDDTIRGIPVLDMPSDVYRQLKKEPTVMSFILSRIETGETPIAEDIINATR